MATFDDVRRIALALPEVTVNAAGTEFRVDGKLFAHPWLERIDPKKARVPNLDVVVVRVVAEADKEVLIQMDPEVFFTEPHFDGYASIHMRLAAVSEPVLQQLITDAWRTRAPKRLLRQATPAARLRGTAAAAYGADAAAYLRSLRQEMDPDDPRSDGRTRSEHLIARAPTIVSECPTTPS